MIHSINNYGLNPETILAKNSNACSDNYVGKLCWNGSQFVNYQNNGTLFDLQTISTTKNSTQNRVEINYQPPYNIYSNGNRKIVILLESPHKNEFTPIGKISTGPALGKAGDTFNECFIPTLNKNIPKIKNSLNLSSNQEFFDIYFVNAIQYQCSLGLSPLNGTIRNNVFTRLWNNQPNTFEDDLIERLNILKPDLIINACTKTLKRKHCNYKNIFNKLTYKNPQFLTAKSHICCWHNNPIIE